MTSDCTCRNQRQRKTIQQADGTNSVCDVSNDMYYAVISKQYNDPDKIGDVKLCDILLNYVSNDPFP